MHSGVLFSLKGIWGLGDSSVDSVLVSQTRSLEFGSPATT